MFGYLYVWCLIFLLFVWLVTDCLVICLFDVVIVWFSASEVFSLSVSLPDLIETWLDSPGLPIILSQHLLRQSSVVRVVDSPLIPILNSSTFPLYTAVLDLHQQVLLFNSNPKNFRRNDPNIFMRNAPDYSVIACSEQLILLLDSLTSLRLRSQVLKHLYEKNQEMITANLDVLHLWCEIVLVNKYKSRYQTNLHFLFNLLYLATYFLSFLPT